MIGSPTGTTNILDRLPSSRSGITIQSREITLGDMPHVTANQHVTKISTVQNSSQVHSISHSYHSSVQSSSQQRHKTVVSYRSKSRDMELDSNSLQEDYLHMDMQYLYEFVSQGRDFTGYNSNPMSTCYLSVRALLHEALSTYDRFDQTSSEIQRMIAESRSEFSSLQSSIRAVINDTKTIDNNVKETSKLLQVHMTRVENFESSTRNVSNLQSIFSSYEDRVSKQSHQLEQTLASFQECVKSVEFAAQNNVFEMRMAELCSSFEERLRVVENTIATLQRNKLNHEQLIPTIRDIVSVSSVDQLKQQVENWFQLWELNSQDVKAALNCHTKRIQTIHSTSCVQMLIELLSKRSNYVSYCVGPQRDAPKGYANISKITESTEAISWNMKVQRDQTSAYLSSGATLRGNGHETCKISASSQQTSAHITTHQTSTVQNQTSTVNQVSCEEKISETKFITAAQGQHNSHTVNAIGTGLTCNKQDITKPSKTSVIRDINTILGVKSIQTKTTIGQVNVATAQSVTNSSEANVATAQSVTNSSEANVVAAQSVTNSSEANVVAAQSVTNSSEANVVASQSVTNSSEANVVASQSGTNSSEANVVAAQSVTNSSEANVVASQSVTNSSEANVVAAQSGTNSSEINVVASQSERKDFGSCVGISALSGFDNTKTLVQSNNHMTNSIQHQHMQSSAASISEGWHQSTESRTSASHTNVANFYGLGTAETAVDDYGLTFDSRFSSPQTSTNQTNFSTLTVITPNVNTDSIQSASQTTTMSSQAYANGFSATQNSIFDGINYKVSQQQRYAAVTPMSSTFSQMHTSHATNQQFSMQQYQHVQEALHIGHTRTQSRVVNVDLGINVKIHNQGVIVRQVKEGSMSMEAGIRVGDIIYAVNGESVKDAPDLLHALHSCVRKAHADKSSYATLILSRVTEKPQDLRDVIIYIRI